MKILILFLLFPLIVFSQKSCNDEYTVIQKQEIDNYILLKTVSKNDTLSFIIEKNLFDSCKYYKNVFKFCDLE